jgi:folate-binding protein YgfZ
MGAAIVSDSAYEVLRIEQGVPLYGSDMDESTIVPELGLDGVISYTKGCYIGQEIIARIHFRGHVAKQLTGLGVSESSGTEDRIVAGADLVSPEGKNAGRITSVTFSPALDKTIALAYVRYDFLAEGTTLLAGELPVTVSGLPFVK